MFHMANEQIHVALFTNVNPVSENWNPESDQFFNKSFKCIEHVRMQSVSFFLFFFFNGRTQGKWKFLDQGLNPSHSYDLHTLDPLIHCAGLRLKPISS